MIFGCDGIFIIHDATKIKITWILLILITYSNSNTGWSDLVYISLYWAIEAFNQLPYLHLDERKCVYKR